MFMTNFKILPRKNNKFMYESFQKPQFMYFIGIGGINMSGLARNALKEGFTVSTCRIPRKSPQQLEDKGARVFTWPAIL